MSNITLSGIVLFILLQMTGASVNVALKKQADQSSREWADKGGPDLVTDGQLGTTIDVDAGTVECCQTKAEKTVWWSVDLGRIYRISSIKILYRNGSADNMNGFNLYVSNTTNHASGYLCYRDNIHATPKTNLDIYCDTTGQYVTFYNERDAPGAVVELCEVEVYGCEPGKYGPNCESTCSCPPGSCKADTGVCDEVNMARGKKALQSSTYNSFVATFAVDGNSWPYLNSGSCTHTDLNQLAAWWRVDLQNTYRINGIRIIYRLRFTDRMKGFSLYVSNTSDAKSGHLCYKDNEPGNPDYKQDIVCDVTGQYVLYDNSRSKGQAFIELCEVEVYGCSLNQFGPLCEKTCACLSGGCNSITGVCDVAGCQAGWMGDSCSIACASGTYGRDCLEDCGHCLNNVACSMTDGICVSGCDPGWLTPQCNIPCTSGTYGKNCQDDCGYCSNNAVCNFTNGVCENGCDPGWDTPQCNIYCPIGKYGQDCREDCGHCLNAETCNNTNGMCENGCGPGWKTDLCNAPCDNGYYGQDCVQSCGHCYNSDTCNNTNGLCGKGCDPGWLTPKCNVSCKNSTHGVNCSLDCGECFGGEQCNIRSGECESGCEPNWKPPFCNIEIISLEPTAEPSILPIALGISVPVIVILVIAIVLVVLLRRRKQNRKSKGTSRMFFAAKQDGSLRGFSNVTSLDGEKDGQEKSNTKEETVYENTVSPRELSANTSKKISDLKDIVDSKIKLADLKHEYEELPKGHVKPHTLGKKTVNIPKNRYKTTFPYDSTRVILSQEDGDENSDYINANYIRDYQSQDAYIATQGPLKKTINDFWRMVWQEQSGSIVMVTNLFEGNKTKCECYWSTGDGCVLETDMFNVSVVKEMQYAFYTVRQLKLKNTETSEERAINHFHFTKWPDHGTPNNFELVQFRQRVSSTKTSLPGPLIVHCSAGIGRTGTFIALDVLLREGESTGEVDVFKFTKSMRENRTNMIQTLEQYVCLHTSLAEGFQMLNVYNQNKSRKRENVKIESQYEKFIEYTPVYMDDKYKCASSEDNITKNRNPGILPLDMYLSFISTRMNGRTNYIFSCSVPSYTNTEGYIMTQFPLPETVVDFWRLVEDKTIDYIVWLGNPLSLKDPVTVWPEKDKGVIKISKFKITVMKTTAISDDISRVNLELNTQGTAKQIVTILYAHGWKINSPLPPSKQCLLNMVEEVLHRHSKAENIPVLVVSPDGVSSTGTYCIASNIVEKLNLDAERDVPSMVRQIQLRQPLCLQSKEQYTFFFEMERTSKDNPASVYANISEVDNDSVYVNVTM